MFRFVCPKFFTFSWITTLVIYTSKYLMTFCQLLIDIRKSFWFSWTRQHLTVYRPLATVEKITRLLRICGTVLQWFQSYLLHRTQSVKIVDFISSETSLLYGVPQDFVLCFHRLLARSSYNALKN